MILNIELFNLITTFKSEPTLKTYVHFIVNSETVILDLSTSAITFFNLELKIIQSKDVRLDSYVMVVLGYLLDCGHPG